MGTTRARVKKKYWGVGAHRTRSKNGDLGTYIIEIGARGSIESTTGLSLSNALGFDDNSGAEPLLAQIWKTFIKRVI